MDRPYVDRLRIKNYGCVQDAELKLTPLHALIGPNDSGKSTVLAALRTVTALPTPGDATAQSQLLTGRWSKGSEIEVAVAGRVWKILGLAPRRVSEKWAVSQQFVEMSLGQGSHNVNTDPLLSAGLKGSQLLRLDPDALRQPTALIPHNAPIEFENERGKGLPAIYDAFLSRKLNAFIAIREQLKTLFPAVSDLELVNPSSSTKALGIKLQNGNSVTADLMSEGLLYFLAYAALPHIQPTAVLLVEEPENGLHPARIADVMRVLREVSKTTQVLIATHSPLVVNELQGDEISVVTRDPIKGTKAVLLKDTPNYEARAKAYSNGELWVSYADGISETALIDGGPRP